MLYCQLALYNTLGDPELKVLMTHPKYWWIRFSVAGSMRDGVALVVSGPCVAHPAVCRVSAQRLITDWLGPEPWSSSEAAHPTMDLDLVAGMDLYHRLAGVQLKVVTPSVAGIDGETYRLEFGAGSNVIRLEWFMEPPTEWSALKPIARLLEALGEHCLSTPNQSFNPDALTGAG
jgi:hypothetical protein